MRVLSSMSKKDIKAGNSFRGLLNALGESLRAFKELIVDGSCGFQGLCVVRQLKKKLHQYSRIIRIESYNYRLKAYMNVVTKEKYSIETFRSKLSRRTESVR